MQGKGVPTEYIEKQYKKGTLEHIGSKLDPKRLVLLKYPCVITVTPCRNFSRFGVFLSIPVNSD